MKAILIMMFFLLVSCVGTVEDVAIDDSKIFTNFKGKFDGLLFGKPVSHSKVQLFFKPATGGGGVFSYVAFVDGNFETAIATLSSEDTRVNSDGWVSMIVAGLPTPGKTYSFTVRAVDLASGSTDANTKSATVTTFDDVYPDFAGITKIENISGISGETQLNIFWNKAKPGLAATGDFGGNPYDIAGYVIYYSESEATVFTDRSASIDDPNQTQFNISGLSSNVTYYVAVRAKDIQNPPRIEKNEWVRTGKTRSSQAINFAGIKKLKIPTSQLGFSQFIAEWDHGTGSFSQYKIFYTSDPTIVIDPFVHSIDTTIVKNVSVTDLGQLPTQAVFVNDANTKYRVAMAACSDSLCTSSAGSNVVMEITTSPPVASFNGIATISPGDGSSSVDSIKLTWSSPDTTTGAYQDFRVYMISGATKTLLPSAPLGVTIGSSTGATITGLTEGNTYCFQAKAYINNPNFPPTATYAGGVEDLNTVEKCLTLQYQQPVFNGINPTCTNITTNTFKVSWTPASGVFDNYEIYYRIGNSSQFNWTDALANNASYTKISPILPSLSNYTMQNLNPGQTYSVGIKTAFTHPTTGVVYRTVSNATVTCTTNTNYLRPMGWSNIMSLGPKVNGLTGSVIYESIIDVGGKVASGPSTYTSVNFPMVSETANVRNKAPLAEDPAVQGINASQTGIVHLVWNDFKYVNGDRFCGSSCTSLGASDGYLVYRMEYSPGHATAPPARNAVGWVLLNAGAPVKPKEISGITTQYLGSFTDYDFPAKADNEARVYWYRVEPVLAGVPAPLLTTAMDATVIYEDYIIKVILPPNNMSMVHRWTANLQSCTKLGRTSDRRKQYRCPYNAIGSQVYSVEGVSTPFYDVGGHTLVDRFELGCNFTRAADSAKSCPAGTYFLSGECISIGTYPTQIWAGSSTFDSAGQIAMPFPMNNMPAGQYSAGTGSVMYNSRILSFEYQITNSTSLTRLMSQAEIEANDSSGVYLPTSCNYFASNNKWTPLHDMGDKLSPDPILKNLGPQVATNSAYMPPMTTLTQSQVHSVCSGFNIGLQLGTAPTDIQYGDKRLPRRAEQIIYSDWSDNLTVNGQLSIEDGMSDLTCLHQTSDAAFLSNARGLATAYNNEGVSSFLAKNSYPSSYANTHKIYRSGSELNDSSAFCQSRYGIRDAIGNVAEWGSDQADCSAGLDCKFATAPTIDVKNRNNYKMPDGSFLNYKESSASADQFGMPLEYGPTLFSGTTRFASSAVSNVLTNGQATFLSPLLGLPLACSGAFCAGGTDDNTQVSALSSTLSHNAAINDFNTRSDAFFMGKFPGNTTAGIIHGGFPITGPYGTPYLLLRGGSEMGVYSGVMLSSKSINAMIGGRCALKVNENETGNFTTSSLLE